MLVIEDIKADGIRAQPGQGRGGPLRPRDARGRRGAPVGWQMEEDRKMAQDEFMKAFQDAETSLSKDPRSVDRIAQEALD